VSSNGRRRGRSATALEALHDLQCRPVLSSATCRITGWPFGRDL